jgi:hypothetical protein
MNGGAQDGAADHRDHSYTDIAAYRIPENDQVSEDETGDNQPDDRSPPVHARLTYSRGVLNCMVMAGATSHFYWLGRP